MFILSLYIGINLINILILIYIYIFIFIFIHFDDFFFCIIAFILSNIILLNRIIFIAGKLFYSCDIILLHVATGIVFTIVCFINLIPDSNTIFTLILIILNLNFTIGILQILILLTFFDWNNFFILHFLYVILSFNLYVIIREIKFACCSWTLVKFFLIRTFNILVLVSIFIILLNLNLLFLFIILLNLNFLFLFIILLIINFLFLFITFNHYNNIIIIIITVVIVVNDSLISNSVFMIIHFLNLVVIII